METGKALELTGSILPAVLVFCRVGTCLMLIPSFSSARVPPQFRLFIAFGITLALFQHGTELAANLALKPFSTVVALMGREGAVGAVFGFAGRIYLAMLEFLADTASACIGLSSPMTAALDNDAQPSLVTLVSLAASTLFFVTDQHLQLIQALDASYAIPATGVLTSPDATLAEIVSALARAAFLALRVGAPFIVYGVFVNMFFGLLNRVAPVIPASIISAPFVLAGGFVLAWSALSEGIPLFEDGFASWLRG